MRRFIYSLSCFFLFILVMTSCSERRPQSVITDDILRKETFFKVVSFFKEGKEDSAKALIVDHVREDTLYFKHTITTASLLVTTAKHELIVTDSVICIDSIKVDGNSIYKYQMNFYDSLNKYYGHIYMSFLNDNTYRPVNLFSERLIESSTITPVKISDY